MAETRHNVVEYIELVWGGGVLDHLSINVSFNFT
jgi:hypothetical protein